MRITMFWSLPIATVGLGNLYVLPTSASVSDVVECNAFDSNERHKNGTRKFDGNLEGTRGELPWWKDEIVTIQEIWDILDCDGVFRKERPIHDISTWTMIREAYIATVGINLSSSDIKSFRERSNGFKQGSVVVKQSPTGKGRAVYAARRIQQGELVWEDDYTACFEEGLLYRHFLASIPAHLTCDVFLWAYTGPSYGVCVDLDEGSFINHATNDIEKKLHFEGTNEKPNVLHSDVMDGRAFAIRDIEPGEEILTDYSSFEEEDNWELLGLGSWNRQ